MFLNLNIMVSIYATCFLTLSQNLLDSLEGQCFVLVLPQVLASGQMSALSPASVLSIFSGWSCLDDMNPVLVVFPGAHPLLRSGFLSILP